MADTSQSALLNAFLRTISDDIIPLTSSGVAKGDKVFGASILRKSTLEVIVSATNNETKSPLLHGETNCLLKFHELGDRPSPKDCILLSTHEPCSLCLSAISWSGFDSFFYLFTYEDTRDVFTNPHDLKILEEVFKVKAEGETDEAYNRRPLYNRQNAFWTGKSVADLIEELDNPAEKAEMLERVRVVRERYNGLSHTYQRSKGKSDIPLP